MRIIKQVEIAEGVYLLSIPKIFEFIPGQVISIGIEANQPRTYSIASGKNDEVIRFLYDVKPAGKVTPLLSRLKPNDTIFVSEPFGNFTCNTEPAFWIAVGTGIAPFYSMFRSGLGKNKVLVHGGKKSENFYFQVEFEQELGSAYIRCCSQQHIPGIYSGRLTQYLRELNHFPPELKYYLCGRTEMVVEVRDILISRHVPFFNILAEIYF